MTWLWRNREAVMWWALAVLIVLHLWERQATAHRAITELRAHGYTEIQLIGQDCRVARAVDKDEEPVLAYSCAWR